MMLGPIAKNRPNALRSSKILVVTLSNAAAVIVRFLIVMLVTNVFDSENSDIFLYAYAASLSVSAISDFGLRTSLFIDVSKPEFFKNGDSWGRILGYRIVSSGLALAAFLMVMLFAGFSPKPPMIFICAMGLYSTNLPLADPFIALLRGSGRNVVECLIRFGENFLTLVALAIASLAREPSITVFSIILSLISFGRLAATLAVSRVIFNPNSRVSLRGVPQVFRANLANGISFLLTSVMQRVPILIIPFLSVDVSVTGITVGLMLIQATQIFSTTAAQFLIPAMNRGGLRMIGIIFNHVETMAFLFISSIFMIPLLFFLFPVIETSLHVSWDVNTKFTLCLGIPAIMLSDYARFLVVSSKMTRLYIVAQAISLAIYAPALSGISSTILSSNVIGMYVLSAAFCAAAGVLIAYQNGAVRFRRSR